MTPPPAEVRECESQSRSGPRRIGPSTLGSAFRVVPLASQYVFLCFLSVFRWLSFCWSVTYPYLSPMAWGCWG